MALITCPECSNKVSSRATSCPQCGFPLAQAQAPDLAAILCSGTWLADSGTLVDAQLIAKFSPNGTFQGQTRPDQNRVVGVQLVAQTNFRGTWQVSGPQLFIEFPLTMSSGPAMTQIAMQFTRMSETSLSGVDEFRRPWEWQQVEQQSAASRTEHDGATYSKKQELQGQILQKLAEMRLQALKAVANNLKDEEASEDKPEPKAGRRRKTAGN